MSPRQFTFIPAGERVLCIDVDPPQKGKPQFTRLRVFVEESAVILETDEVETARAALTLLTVKKGAR